MALLTTNYFNSSKFTGTIEFDPRFGISGFEKYKDIRFDFPEQTCDLGKFVGHTQDDDTDCSTLCKDFSGESRYMYMFFNKPVDLYGRKFHGGYCLPRRVTQCNETTSEILWQSGYYGCIPKYPHILTEFNRIVGCNGYLQDGLTNTIYENFLPPEVVVQDIDERLTTGQYRFSCAKQTDLIGNDMIRPNTKNRFTLIRNPCATLIKNALLDYARLTDEFKCQCRTPYENLFGKETNPCTACNTQYDFIKKTVSIARNVYTTGILLKRSNHFLWPPGLDSVTTGSGCERGTLHISTSYSPITLANM